MVSSELQIGKAGEHLVCCDLIVKGYNAFLADAGLPYDVLVDLDGTIKKIQVKTSTKMKDAGRSKNIYRFNLRKGKGTTKTIKSKDIDYIAFVMLDRKIVQYIQTNKISNKNGELVQCLDFSDNGNGNKIYIIGRFDNL